MRNPVLRVPAAAAAFQEKPLLSRHHRPFLAREKMTPLVLFSLLRRAQDTVDENFFTTVLRKSSFCGLLKVMVHDALKFSGNDPSLLIRFTKSHKISYVYFFFWAPNTVNGNARNPLTQMGHHAGLCKLFTLDDFSKKEASIIYCEQFFLSCFKLSLYSISGNAVPYDDIEIARHLDFTNLTDLENTGRRLPLGLLVSTKNSRAGGKKEDTLRQP